MVDCGVTSSGARSAGCRPRIARYPLLASEPKNLKAIIITHAHEDHYGALS
ncbi:MBL fold metallo-hydrolase [Rhizobium beringeri]